MSDIVDVNNIKVTIVMPVYNAIEYLQDSIVSILNQSYEEFELICVDDGSTDGSSDYLDKCAENDKRIIVIHQENQGGGAARNRGLKAAKGKYIIFFDSDDKFERELLEKTIAKADSDNLDITIFNGDTFDNVTGEIKSAPWLIRGDVKKIEKEPFDVVNTSVWNKLFRREYLEEKNLFFQNNRIADNIFFTFMSIIYASRIGIVNEVLIHYRTNNTNSITSKSDRYPKDTINALLSIKNRLEQDGVFEEKKNIYVGFAAEYLINRLRVFKTQEGFGEFYSLLHNGGLEELGLFPYTDFNNKKLEEIKIIYEKSIEEYLFSYKFVLQTTGFLRNENYIIPKEVIKANKKIVIYGGGNVGKDYFFQLSKMDNIRIVSWVDQNFEKMGYPIQTPELLKNIEFDQIIIAVLSEKVANGIKDYLVNMGIPPKSIVWRKPIAI